MNRIKIGIVKLGESKHETTIKKLNRYQEKSKLFEISDIKQVNLPNCDNSMWEYSDSTLLPLFSSPSTNSDIQIGIIDYPIQANYFGRKLSSSIGVISFYQTDQIFREANLDLVNFLLLTIYQTVVLYSCNNSIRDGENSLYHDESRKCIFDMCGLKDNITLSASNPTICPSCEAKIRQKPLDEKFIF